MPQNLTSNPVLRSVDNLDKKLSYIIFSKGHKAKPVLKGLEWSCHGLIWLSTTILFIVCNPQQSSMVPKLLIGLIMDIFYVAILKATARRRRPTYANQRDQVIVAGVDKHSFPSGHCSRSIYISLFVRHYFAHSSPFLVFVITVWALSVCFSRVLLGRHHVLDCVAGGILGFLNYTLQFHSFLPINAVGMYLMRSFFGSKAFNDVNDIEGSDAFTE